MEYKSQSHFEYRNHDSGGDFADLSIAIPKGDDLERQLIHVSGLLDADSDQVEASTPLLARAAVLSVLSSRLREEAVGLLEEARKAGASASLIEQIGNVCALPSGKD